MSYADKVFKEICETIINDGSTTEGQKVRPIWPDTGESAYTIKTFGVSNIYDLRKEFPALTFRKTALKSAFDEILWIYQKKSNNIRDLNSSVWDEWADESGSIGRAYGYQVGQCSHFMDVVGRTDMSDEFKREYPSTRQVISRIDHLGPTLNIYMDQMDILLYELKNNPFSRRLKINLWNPTDLKYMALQPCCYDLTFNVTDEGGDKLVLNLALNQRSQDMLAANNWNTAQYALLLMAVAQVVDMVPGKLMHTITDAHIYDRHVPIIKELIQRPMYDAPIVKLDPSIKNFYDFTKESVIVENYIAGPQVNDIPIAV